MEFNFAQNTVVDDINKVPNDFRGLYQKDEADGKYKLRSEDAGVKSAISAITGLNSALVQVRGELVTAKGKAVDISSLSEYGDSPEAVLEAFNNKITELGKGKKGVNVAEEVAKAVKSVKDALGKTHGEELVKHVNKSKALTGQLYSLLVTNAATNALVEAKALNPKLVMPFIKEQVQVSEEDGKFKVNVVNSDSKDIRFSGVTGDPMSIKELVAEMKTNEQYMPLFQSDSHSGAGGDPHKTGRKRTVGTGTEEKNSTDKISSGLTNLKRS